MFRLPTCSNVQSPYLFRTIRKVLVAIVFEHCRRSPNERSKVLLDVIALRHYVGLTSSVLPKSSALKETAVLFTPGGIFAPGVVVSSL